MRQSLKIIVSGKSLSAMFKQYVKRHAEKLSIFGSVQKLENDDAVIILTVGDSNNLDEFIDYLYETSEDFEIHDVQVEPLVQKKNFRETFRIIGE